MNHTVTVEEITDWMNQDDWRFAASSFSRDSNKSLEVSNTGVWRVTDQNEIVYLGKEISAAVEAYNAAR